MTVALKNVAEALRAARRRARLSQTAVAKYIGSTRQTIAAFEKGERQPGIAYAMRLANLYRVSLDELASLRQAARNLPVFHARFERERGLSANDRSELESFCDYLRTRPPSRIDVPARRRYASISDVADRVRHDAGVMSPPVPIEEIIAKAGIEVRFTPLDELAGALLLPTSANEPVGILVNSDQPRERERFTLAHEYGHLVLGHEAKAENAFVDHIGRRFEPVEVQADVFAAELLMPVEMLRGELDALPEDDSLEISVYRLALRFFVSFQAMTARLDKLGVLTPEELSSLQKAKPSLIAKNLGSARRAGRPFNPRKLATWLAGLAFDGSPPTPEGLRLLQDAALAHYAKTVPEAERSEAPAAIFERVAVWVADKYPLYAS